MPVKKGAPETAAQPAAAVAPVPQQWEYLELLVGVGNEIWDSNGNKRELNEIQVGDPRFPRHYYSAAPLLNELGRQGWEVTGIVGDLSTYILVLKRQKAAPEGGMPDEASEPEPIRGRRPSRSVAQRLRGEPGSTE
jgi:hypothetical protein